MIWGIYNINQVRITFVGRVFVWKLFVDRFIQLNGFGKEFLAAFSWLSKIYFERFVVIDIDHISELFEPELFVWFSRPLVTEEGRFHRLYYSPVCEFDKGLL